MSHRHSFGSVVLAAALLALTTLTTPAQAQKRDRPPVDSLKSPSSKVLAAFKPVVATPSESTVRVLCDGKDAALGTIVTADGFILTKFSELRGEIVCRLKNDKVYPAAIVGVHEPTDLALLKIAAKGLRPVEWRDPKEAVVGNWVATPGTGELPVAVGVVSVAARKVTARDLPPTSNLSGGYLGVGLEETDEGVRITRVEAGSPAAKAGFKAGDIVVAAGAKAIRDVESLIQTIQGHKPGETVALKVWREDEVKELKATLAKRPANNRGDFQNRLGSELSNKRNGFPAILQHDAVIKPSDCGGPLVDLEGKAVGVNIARAGRVESYAIPADVVQSLLPDLKSGKLAPKKADEGKIKK